MKVSISCLAVKRGIKETAEMTHPKESEHEDIA